MSKENYAVLYDPALVQMRDKHINRIKKVYDGKSFGDTALALWGFERQMNGTVVTDIDAEVDKALTEIAAKADGLRDELVFRPINFTDDLLGVHFIDKMFGGDVFMLDDMWQVRLLETPVGTIEMPDLDRDPTWRRAREIADAFLATGVTVPFFSMPTIASALNIGVNLYGGAILEAMIANPNAARRDLRIINDVLITITRWFLNRIPAEQLQPVAASVRTQPPGFGQLCGCSTQMLSRDQYAEFVAPLDAALLGVYPHGGMIHLCGEHAQHIPTFRAMKELRAMQFNGPPNDQLDQYFYGTRDDQVFYISPTEKMPVELVMEKTNGNRVIIVKDIQEPTPIKRRAAK